MPTTAVHASDDTDSATQALFRIRALQRHDVVCGNRISRYDWCCQRTRVNGPCSAGCEVTDHERAGVVRVLWSQSRDGVAEVPGLCATSDPPTTILLAGVDGSAVHRLGIGADGVSRIRAAHQHRRSTARTRLRVRHTIGAEQHIVLSVVVDVAGGRDGDAEAVASPFRAVDREACEVLAQLHLPRHVAKDNPGHAVGGVRVPLRGSDVSAEHEVGLAVPVDIPGRCESRHPLCRRPLDGGDDALRVGNRDRGDVGAAGHDRRQPGPLVASQRDDADIVLAVAVEVGNAGGEEAGAVVFVAGDDEPAVAEVVEQHVLRLTAAEDDEDPGLGELGDDDVIDIVTVDVSGAADTEAGQPAVGDRTFDADDTGGRVIELPGLRAAGNDVGDTGGVPSEAVPHPGARDDIVPAVAGEVTRLLGYGRPGGRARGAGPGEDIIGGCRCRRGGGCGPHTGASQHERDREGRRDAPAVRRGADHELLPVGACTRGQATGCTHTTARQC